MMINSTWTQPWMDDFFPLITDLHKTLPFKIIVPLLVLALLWKKYRRHGGLIFIGCLLCLGFTDAFSSQILKKSVARPRPFETVGVVAIQRSPAGGSSFPSNHSANMFAFATYTSFFVPAAAPLVFPLAALIAYSRVYNGVHFPLDVFGGAFVGLIFGILFSRSIQRFLKNRLEPSRKKI